MLSQLLFYVWVGDKGINGPKYSVKTNKQTKSKEKKNNYNNKKATNAKSFQIIEFRAISEFAVLWRSELNVKSRKGEKI